jgi:hypothetical protein
MYVGDMMMIKWGKDGIRYLVVGNKEIPIGTVMIKKETRS